MLESRPGLMEAVRERFAHVDRCPFTGPRIFFENAGGALTLKSVVETSAKFAAIPDNQGRDNPASHALMGVIDQARQDMRLFFNAESGKVFVGESGTELLFRVIAGACLGAAPGGRVLGTTLEHPASRSACARWAAQAGQPYDLVPHDDATGCVTADDYVPHLGPDLRVATIIHTSPVTGMGVDIAAIAHAIRRASPECLIIVDGIQHAAHGGVDVTAAGIDGYVISPYKAFSRHGYGVAWTSDRLTALPHNALAGGPEGSWELGTRDTGAYATFSDVIRYLDWLGGEVCDADTPPARLAAAATAIRAHERDLTERMLHGVDNQPGLASMPGVTIIGGTDNPAREGLVAFWAEGRPSGDLVSALNGRGIRTHVRKADHYSGNILKPLGREDCVRVSLCHYNCTEEVKQFLTSVREILES